MDGYIAMVLEGRGNGESGRERAAETVDEYVDGLALVTGENVVNIVAVEVIASDTPFQVEVLLCLCHSMVCIGLD